MGENHFFFFKICDHRLFSNKSISRILSLMHEWKGKVEVPDLNIFIVQINNNFEARETSYLACIAHHNYYKLKYMWRVTFTRSNHLNIYAIID